jgi:hypothetical protein
MKVNAMVIGFVAAFALLQTALVVSAGAAGDATTPAQEVRPIGYDAASCLAKSQCFALSLDSVLLGGRYCNGDSDSSGEVEMGTAATNEPPQRLQVIVAGMARAGTSSLSEGCAGQTWILCLPRTRRFESLTHRTRIHHAQPQGIR